METQVFDDDERISLEASRELELDPLFRLRRWPICMRNRTAANPRKRRVGSWSGALASLRETRLLQSSLERHRASVA